jgi:hypothetical protein
MADGLRGFAATGGMQFKADILTLASGTVEFDTGMTRCIVIATFVDPSAAISEYVTVIETELANGTLAGPLITVTSSNGSSTEKVSVLAVGF